MGQTISQIKNYVSARTQTQEQKVSAVIWIIFAALWVGYFVAATTHIADKLNGETFRIWVTEQPSLEFPQFVLCPANPSGTLSGTVCKMLTTKGSNGIPDGPVLPSTAIQPGAFSDYPGYTCYGYNLDARLDVGNYSVFCISNCTATMYDRYCSMHAYFDAPGTKNFLKCAQCVSGKDNYVLSRGAFSSVGLELTSYAEEDDDSGDIGTQDGLDPDIDGVPVRSYTAIGTSVYDPNISETTSMGVFYWNSHVMWHYQKFTYYDFWSWLGFIGGAGFFMKMMHDIIMVPLVIFVFKTSESARQGYAEVN